MSLGVASLSEAVLLMDEREPTAKTMEEIGRLCGAWSYLELVTEVTLWGILEVDAKIGPVITYRLDMRGRWSLLMEWAPRKHATADLQELSNINTDVTTVNTDRNIIVHGIVHALAKTNLGANPPPYTVLDAENITEFERVPCWTVSRGSAAGKNFPLSSGAVETVRLNIQKVGRRVATFNARFGYVKTVTPMPGIEVGWPKPL
jgi:hypothetical protein